MLKSNAKDTRNDMSIVGPLGGVGVALAVGGFAVAGIAEIEKEEREAQYILHPGIIRAI